MTVEWAEWHIIIIIIIMKKSYDTYLVGMILAIQWWAASELEC